MKMGYKQTNNIIERAAGRRDAIFKWESKFGEGFSTENRKKGNLNIFTALAAQCTI